MYLCEDGHINVEYHSLGMRTNLKGHYFLREKKKIDAFPLFNTKTILNQCWENNKNICQKI